MSNGALSAQTRGSYSHRMKILLLLIAALSFSEPAFACKHSLGVGAGLVRLEVPRETDFQIGAEYECRVNPFLGVGGFFNSIFSDPSILIFGAPELLLPGKCLMAH
jgi:hypothetical protein